MSTRPAVLVVDPDSVFRQEVEEVLRVEGFRVIHAGDLASGRRQLESQAPAALVVSLRLPDGQGLDLVRDARSASESIVSVVTGEYPDTREVVEAIRRGAVDVLEKPVFPERIANLLVPALEDRRVERAARPQRGRAPAHLSRPPIVGRSPALGLVLDQVSRVAATPNTTVLIQGESGTGKELVARAIHFDGHRKNRAFMAINCAALNETILEAELFGYEKGAFTGANAGGKQGLFEAADGGTVFLDEIGEMSSGLQAKLLRVLQENSFKRVGGVQDISVDIRIIAATNRDLWEEVAAGRFRKDLYFRLNVMPIRVPGLRERREDIAELARHFLEMFATSMRKPVRSLAEESERLLLDHPWPGNVRELRNVCEYAVIVCDGAVIEPRHLALPEPLSIDQAVGSGGRTSGPAVEGDSGSEDALASLPIRDWSLRSMEEELIRMVLSETRFNITRAARALGINRSTLYNKMKDYGLSRDEGALIQQAV